MKHLFKNEKKNDTIIPRSDRSKCMNYLYEHNSIIHLINNPSDGLEYLYMLISNDDTNYNKY